MFMCRLVCALAMVAAAFPPPCSYGPTGVAFWCLAKNGHPIDWKLLRPVEQELSQLRLTVLKQRFNVPSSMPEETTDWDDNGSSSRRFQMGGILQSSRALGNRRLPTTPRMQVPPELREVLRGTCGLRRWIPPMKRMSCTGRGVWCTGSMGLRADGRARPRRKQCRQQLLLLLRYWSLILLCWSMRKERQLRSHMPVGRAHEQDRTRGL